MVILKLHEAIDKLKASTSPEKMKQDLQVSCVRADKNLLKVITSNVYRRI